MQEIKQEYQISGIIAGMNAQVEVKPHQENVSRATWQNLESWKVSLRGLLMEWITKYEVKLANTFCKDWEARKSEDKQAELLGSRMRCSCRS